MQAPPEIQAMFGTPGEPVPTVNTEDIKTLWRVRQEGAARHPGAMCAMGMELIKHVCSSEAEVKAVTWRGMRLEMLMMRLGKRDVQPPAFLFTIFAKVPMKWWALGVPRRDLF